MSLASLSPQLLLGVLAVEAYTSNTDLSFAFAFPFRLYGVDTRVAAEPDTSRGGIDLEVSD